jgi:hypothetical protein
MAADFLSLTVTLLVLTSQPTDVTYMSAKWHSANWLSAKCCGVRKKCKFQFEIYPHHSIFTFKGSTSFSRNSFCRLTFCRLTFCRHSVRLTQLWPWLWSTVDSHWSTKCLSVKMFSVKRRVNHWSVLTDTIVKSTHDSKRVLLLLTRLKNQGLIFQL